MLFACLFVVLASIGAVAGSRDFERHELKDNHYVLFKAPSNAHGVLVLFHGCNHNPEDWFQLPSETTLISKAFERGFVCVAIPSFDRQGSRCWSPEADTKRVNEAYTHVIHPRWKNLPIVGAGASSGGTFLTFLANSQTIPLRAAAVYISPGLPPFVPVLKTHAPSIFIHMSGDEDMASQQRVDEYRSRLRAVGVSSEELLCGPHVFAAQFLRTATSNQPHHHWPMPFCVSIIHYLQHEHMLTRAGVLLRDPRAAEPEWQRALKKAGEESGTTVGPLEVEALRELLNVAWGVHEMTGEHADDVVTFLVRHAS